MTAPNNWIEFWTALRAPLENIHPIAPWAALFVVALALEWITDQYVAPFVAQYSERAARVLTAGFDGVRAGLFAGAFAAGTTLDAELALGGAVIGVFVAAAKVYAKDALDWPKWPPGPGAAAVVIGLCTACTPLADTRTPEEVTRRQLCLAYAESRARLEAQAQCIQPGLGWQECPYRAEIMHTLTEDQEKCRE